MATPPSAAPLPAPATIDQDIPCVRCRYNLRTLSRGGRCPECGLAVELTLTIGRELHRSRPAYVRRLAMACQVLFASRLLAFLALLIAMLAQSEAHLSTSLLAAMLLYGCGLWLLSAREHRQLPCELCWTRGLLRLCALTLLVAGGMIVILLLDPSSWSQDTLRLAVQVITYGAFLLDRREQIGFLAVFAACVCLLTPILETRLMVRLARRLADAWLGEHALIAGVGCTVAGLALPGITLLQASIGRGDWFIAPALIIIAILLFCLWMCVCSLIAARGFAMAARTAARSWNPAAIPPATPAGEP